MALVADVAKTGLEPGANETCSELSVARRYPLAYDPYLPWDYVFRNVMDQFRRLSSSRSLLKSLELHARRCRGQGHARSLYNPFEPDACFQDHPVLEDWVKFRDANFTRSRQLQGALTDWLGLKIDCSDSTANSFSLTRIAESRPFLTTLCILLVVLRTRRLQLAFVGYFKNYHF